jgi:hypothetical protein
VLLALLRWRSKSTIPGFGKFHIDQVDLQSFHDGLPHDDEDGFMAELRALPDQDELEESKVPGTW